MKEDDLLDDNLARPASTRVSDEGKRHTRPPYFSTASLICLWVAVLGWSYPQFHRMLGFSEIEHNPLISLWRLIGETMVLPAILIAILLQMAASGRHERMTVSRAILFLSLPASVILFVIVRLFFAFAS